MMSVSRKFLIIISLLIVLTISGSVITVLYIDDSIARYGGLFPCSAPRSPTSIQEIANLARIEFCSRGTRLVGTLVMPDGEGPFPLLIFVPSPGAIYATRSTRDMLVYFFKQAGYALFFPDQRGVGDSAGFFPQFIVEGEVSENCADLIQLQADDLLASAYFLRNLQEINPEQIGFIGWDQAGWIIPLAASQSNISSFSVIVSGATVSVGVQNFWEHITEGYIPSIEHEALSAELATFDGNPGFDPRTSIMNMTNPGLWLWGDKDPIIPSRESKSILEEIIQDYNKFFTIIYSLNNGHNWFYNDLIIDWLNNQTMN
ncbi:MAG: alpha/beta hydrolase family protein [Candidatus Thorarchaeota archaeon]